MGSYKWGYAPLIWVISIVTLLIALLIITTHEPPRNRIHEAWVVTTFLEIRPWLGC